jgi:hypothetical protein
MNELLAAYRYTTNNYAQIEKSKRCGCCNCLQIFRPAAIVGWTGLTVQNMDDPKAISEQTAMCPHCGSEAVIGDGCGFLVTPDFLTRMNEAWFQRTMIHRPKPKAAP